MLLNIRLFLQFQEIIPNCFQLIYQSIPQCNRSLRLHHLLYQNVIRLLAEVAGCVQSLLQVQSFRLWQYQMEEP